MGKRARPDMYISSPGRCPFQFATARVLVSFTPNTSPSLSASSFRFLRIFTASSHWRSFSKDSRLSFTSVNPKTSCRIRETSSYPRRVGLSFTKVWRRRSSMRYVAIFSISSGGQPCMVERVTEFVIRAGISMSVYSGNFSRRIPRISSSSEEASCSRSMNFNMGGLVMPFKS